MPEEKKEIKLTALDLEALSLKKQIHRAVKRENYQEAMRLCRLMSYMKPDDPMVYFNWAVYAIRFAHHGVKWPYEQPDEAIPDLPEGVTDNPEGTISGSDFVKNHILQKAEAICEIAISLFFKVGGKFHSGALYNLARLQCINHNWVDAAETFAMMLDVDMPDNLEKAIIEGEYDFRCIEVQSMSEFKELLHCLKRKHGVEDVIEKS